MKHQQTQQSQQIQLGCPSARAPAGLLTQKRAYSKPIHTKIAAQVTEAGKTSRLIERNRNQGIS